MTSMPKSPTPLLGLSTAHPSGTESSSRVPSSPDMIVSSIASKIYKGDQEVRSDELDQLRIAAARDLKEGTTAIPYLDRDFLNKGFAASPLNNTNTSNNGNLHIVRYIGMVQDMLDQEYYQSRVNGVNTKYRDYYYDPRRASANREGGQEEGRVGEEIDLGHNLQERQPLVVVPIPFTSAWFRDVICPSKPPDSEMNTENREERDKARDTTGGEMDTRGDKRSHPGVGQTMDESFSSPPQKQRMSSEDCTPATEAGASDELGEEGGGDAASPICIPGRAPPSFLAAQTSSSGGIDFGVFGTGVAAGGSSDWWPAGCMGSDPLQCPILAKVCYDDEDRVNDEKKTNDDGDPPTRNGLRLRLNDVVELIGVLCVDPMDADFTEQQRRTSGSGGGAVTESQTGGASQLDMIDESFVFEDDMHEHLVVPPPSLLPRLHVLCYNNLDLDSMALPVVCSRKVVDEDITKGEEEPPCSKHDKTYNEEKKDDRSLAIQAFSRYIFDGNDVASEALLMVLMSMAEREKTTTGAWNPVKTPSDTTLGCTSLNLLLTDAASCEVLSRRLQAVVEEVVPVACGCSLSLDGLNSSDFRCSISSPFKNLQGKLVPSSMQLPQGSAVIINRGSLSEGRVDHRGQQTLTALSSMTQFHTVPYQFEGMMNYNFEADYRIIVISCAVTGKTENRQVQCGSTENKLLPCAMRMELGDFEASGDAMDVLNDRDAHSSAIEKTKGKRILPSVVAEKIRAYLSRCRANRHLQSYKHRSDKAVGPNIPFSNEVLEQAQKDFVQRRVNSRSKNERQVRLKTLSGNFKGTNNIGVRSRLHEMNEIGEEDFHRWLTLARLHARSRFGVDAEKGEHSDVATARHVTVDDWHAALHMDDAMRSN